LKHISVLLLTLLALCLPSSCVAQATNATISGVVLDPSGRVIPDADVEILNDATGVQYACKTNGVGIYTLSILPPGQYRVQLSKIGYKTLIKPGVILNVESAVALNFTLPVGATSESITVEAGASMLNTTDASVSTVVDRKFVENMPLNGRSFQDLISMTPGVVTQSPQSGGSVGTAGDFSVNGQRTESNYYTVDGVTGNINSGNGGGVAVAATGGALGGSTALGTTQSLISVDALQEFRVQGSTYSAEYGRSPGGQFSLVTRSGSNSIHGGIFDYLRNDFFDASDWFNDHYGKPIPALRQNDFGGTFGGPIWIPHLYDGRRRSFVFASYEGLRLTQPTAATIQYVPDFFMRQQAVPAMRPILNAYPVANGHDYGTASSPNLAQFVAPYSLPSAIDSTSVRVDQTIAPQLSLFFRYGKTPSSTSSRPYFALSKTQIDVQTYTLGATSQLTKQLTNEFRLGYDRSNSSQNAQLDSFGGAIPIDLAAAMGAGSFATPAATLVQSVAGIGLSLINVGHHSNLGRQWNIVDTFSADLGRHQLKAGIDYAYIKSPIEPTTPTFIVSFTSAPSVVNDAPAFPQVYHYVHATPIFHDFSFFVQDEWFALSNLNVSLGIRWDVNPPAHEEHGNDAYTLVGGLGNASTLAVAPQGTPLWKTTWYNFSPRLGVAWTAHDKSGGETIVHAGGGVFFDSANEVAASGYGGLGFVAHNLYLGASLPFTAAQINVPISTVAPYTSANLYAFPQHLQLPYTLEWSASLQQALGKNQALTVSYVGANGRRLIGMQQLTLTPLNANFGTVYYLPSGITSNYQGLEVQLQRSVAKGLHALASYTWSHSLDFGSSATALPLKRGNSDFDVRSNFQGGISWDLPGVAGSELMRCILDDWGLDARFNARTAFPVTLGGNLITDLSTGNVYAGGLNVVSGQPIYLYGAQYPGGRSLNKAAFSVPATGSSGNAPRNFVRGFTATQINIAARRDFPLHDSVALQFRAEAFNILNHPNFGYIDPTYTDATFGQATKMLNSSLATVATQYQQGGPRSMQFAMTVRF
jgi:hypothetical protein